MTVSTTFELWQDGMKVAAVHAPTREQAWSEINHYAMVYSQDGPVEIRGKGGRRLRDGECAPKNEEKS